MAKSPGWQRELVAARLAGLVGFCLHVCLRASAAIVLYFFDVTCRNMFELGSTLGDSREFNDAPW